MTDKKKTGGNPLFTYVKGAYVEVRKVTWPTREETWKKTWIVVAFSAAFAVFLGSMDYIFNYVIEIVL